MNIWKIYKEASEYIAKKAIEGNNPINNKVIIVEAKANHLIMKVKSVDGKEEQLIVVDSRHFELEFFQTTDGLGLINTSIPSVNSQIKVRDDVRDNPDILSGGNPDFTGIIRHH